MEYNSTQREREKGQCNRSVVLPEGDSFTQKWPMGKLHGLTRKHHFAHGRLRTSLGRTYVGFSPSWGDVPLCKARFVQGICVCVADMHLMHVKSSMIYV